MGCSGVNIGYGLQRLIDAQQRFVRNAHPVYLRTRNFTPPQNSLYAQLGYSITPGDAEAGTTDLCIMPRPAVRMISQHNIGMSQGKLRFGARTFVISATFVDNLNLGINQSALEAFWHGPTIVGLVVDLQLFSIEQVAHEEYGGKTVLWSIDCNANEVR